MDHGIDLLRSTMIRARLNGIESTVLSLPQLYESLAADRILSITALRAHQRHPFHALLCQLGALACLKAGLSEPPRDAATWKAILSALTPDFPEGEPWRLVAPPDRPAFLQPVVGPLEPLKPLSTPDELDMLVTAKNHDLKGARMATAMPDDWLFALVALQTNEGFLGAGNFGASRMNGGFANRPGVSIVPPGGMGAHVMRDVQRLIDLFEPTLDRYLEYEEDGPALLWLIPWDGNASLPRKGLHPYYIEVSRRVRLVESGGALAARVGNSRAMRVSMTKDEGGVTGDPWTPIRRDAGGKGKALTVDGNGFHYRRLSDILNPEVFAPAPLQEFAADETGEGWTLLCRAIARGQGKTEGYHERRERIPKGALMRMNRGEYDALAGLSKARIDQVSGARSALRFGLMTLFQNGPDPSDFKPQDPSSGRRAEPFLERFQGRVDQSFFESLFEEFSVGEAPESAHALRTAWVTGLRDKARRVLAEAKAGAPTSATRRHRAAVRADRALDRGLYGAKDLRDYIERTRNAV